MQLRQNTVMVHIHWASHAWNQWSHARLQFFFLMQGFKAVFFHHIVIVSDINYHNMVKNTVYLCIPYSLLPEKMWSLAWDLWFRAWDAVHHYCYTCHPPNPLGGWHCQIRGVGQRKTSIFCKIRGVGHKAKPAYFAKYWVATRRHLRYPALHVFRLRCSQIHPISGRISARVPRKNWDIQREGG